MTMHLNSWGLFQHGFHLVASYHMFKKGDPLMTVECYTNGTEYLVRHYRSGCSAWDDVFDNKDDANNKVKYLSTFYTGYKRII